MKPEPPDTASVADALIIPEVLGYFSPSTFTIKTKYSPDVDHWPDVRLKLNQQNVRAFSNFVHELTHYLQFSGTIFGLKYQLARAQETLLLARLLRKNLSRGDYELPFVDHVNIKSWSPDEYEAVMTARCIAQETNQLIAGSPQRRAWAKGERVDALPDPGIFVSSASAHFPLSGMVAMENWATWNQHLLISAPSLPAEIRAVLYEEYVAKRSPDYTFINHMLAGSGRDFLAPFIYWIAFNPPLRSQQDDWRWLAQRVVVLVDAAMKMPKESLPTFQDARDWLKLDELESRLCDLAGYERPRECIKAAIQDVEGEGKAVTVFPEIRLALDVLRWAESKESIVSHILWPAAASLLDEDLARTPFRDFPIWLVEYEGKPVNERYGYNVHQYPDEFFREFEQMRLWRSLLPALAWAGPDRKAFACPVLQLRSCPTAQVSCNHLFCSPRPSNLDKAGCFLGLSLENVLNVPMDKMHWG